MLTQWIKKNITREPNLLFCFFSFFFAQFLYALICAGFGKGFLSVIIFPQFWIPWDIVKGHPWQSLFYYHVQAPLFTAYIFLCTLVFPPDGQLGIYLLHTGLGLFAISALYKIQIRLGVNKNLATLLILIFILSPTFNLFETWGLYDFPVMCLLLIATHRLMKLIDLPSWRNGFYFFLTISLLCNIRPLYHIAFYFIPVLVTLMWVLNQHKKIILQSAIIPFVLLLVPYVKNYYLFHIFTLNSWQGEVLSNATMQWHLSLTDRLDGIKKGYFSDLALCPHTADGFPNKFENMGYTGYYCYDVIAQKYRDTFVNKLNKDYSGIAILNSVSGDKRLHRNVLGNIGMSQEYGKNAVASFIHYPYAYFASINEGWRLYFTKSPSYFFDVMGNPRQLSNSLLSSWLSYHPYVSSSMTAGSENISLILLFMLPLLIIFGVAYIKIPQRLMSFTVIYLLGLIAFFSGFLYLTKTRFDWPVQYYVMWAVLGYNVISIIPLYLLSHFEPAKKCKENIIIAFILCNILYTTLMINFTTGTEEQRYRFYLDGFYFILLGLFLTVMLKQILGLIKRVTHD